MGPIQTAEWYTREGPHWATVIHIDWAHPEGKGKPGVVQVFLGGAGTQALHG